MSAVGARERERERERESTDSEEPSRRVPTAERGAILKINPSIKSNIISTTAKQYADECRAKPKYRSGKEIVFVLKFNFKIVCQSISRIYDF